MEQLLEWGSIEVAVVLTLLLFFKLYQQEQQRWRLPPGPRPLPVLGNLTSMVGSGRLEVELAALSARHGPLMWLRLGTRNTLVVNSPEMARIVLREQDAVFADRPPPSFALGEVLGPIDLFSPHSSTWKKHKGVGAAEVFSQRRVRDLQPCRGRDIAAAMATVRDLVAAAAAEGLPAAPAFPFRALGLGLFLNMFSDIAYGRPRCAAPPPGASSAAVLRAWADWIASYERLIGDGMRLATAPAVADVFPALAFLDAVVSRKMLAEVGAYKKTVTRTFGAIVDERRLHWQRQGAAGRDAARSRQQQQHDDRPALSICDTLLLGKHSEDGAPAPHGFIVRMLHGFMMAAGSAPWWLEWTMAELQAHPRYLALLQEEMDRAVGRDRLVQDDDISRLPLLRAVMLESMRLHPPSPLTLPHCNSQQAASVAGYHVPKGTTVIVNIHGIGRNPEVWPEPHAFQPQRFLDRPDLENTGRHLEMPTYGSGRRMCPSAHFMNRVLSLVLARCVQCFHWELAPGHQIDFTPSPGAIASPATPLLVVPSMRLPPNLYNLPIAV